MGIAFQDLGVLAENGVGHARFTHPRASGGYRETIVEKVFQSGQMPTNRCMPLLTHDIVSLCQKYGSDFDILPHKVTCPDCSSRSLSKQLLDYEWLEGSYIVLFPDIPAFRCNACDVTAFPLQQLRDMEQAVETVMSQSGIDRLDCAAEDQVGSRILVQP